MDMKIVKVLFKIGNIFALTPSSPEKQNSSFFEKLYVLSVFLLLTVGSIVTFCFRWPEYVELSATKFVTRIIMDAVFYCHNCDSVIGVMIFKRSQLLKLFKNINRVEYQITKKSYFTENPHFVTFVVVQIVKLGAIVLYNYVYMSVEDNFLTVIKMYIIEYFQTYTQFFNMFFAYVVLRMLLVRYRYLTGLIREKITRLSVYNSSVLLDLHSVKRKLFILKQSVGGFNYIFGWTILTFIFYGVTQNLLYVDTIIKGKKQVYGNRTTSWIILHSVYHFVMLSSFWVYLPFYIFDKYSIFFSGGICDHCCIVRFNSK